MDTKVMLKCKPNAHLTLFQYQLTSAEVGRNDLWYPTRSMHKRVFLRPNV